MAIKINLFSYALNMNGLFKRQATKKEITVLVIMAVIAVLIIVYMKYLNGKYQKIVINPKGVVAVEYLKGVSLDANDEFLRGQKEGEQAGREQKTEIVNGFLPLKEYLSQYELGFLDGYHVACHDASFACKEIDKIINTILEQKRTDPNKYKVEFIKK